MTNEDEKEIEQARKKVRQLRFFYRHLATYVVVIVFLHILNWMTSSYYWARWPMIGWGFSVTLHWTQIIAFFPIFDENWEERKVQELLAKKAKKASMSSH
ncbi:MAG: 2TM domain-containing protein [Sneathiella sp.]|nr:2TM domain-containing protein [Sneathiella sp.]